MIEKKAVCWSVYRVFQRSPVHVGLSGAHGDGLLVAGLFFTDYPPSWEKIPPVEDPGLCDPLGEPGWLSW